MELYDDNPTIVDIRSEKEEILHERQGEVFAGKASVDNPGMKRFYIESYGCAMNFSDSEIIASILADAGYAPTREIGDSDLILINTCSIRDKAEETVRKRLETYSIFKKKRPGTLVGVLGCMAERLKKKLLEEDKMVDMVVGPDAYRTLPNLIDNANGGQRSVNVLLSREETYAEIAPVRLETNGISAFISIMRGCDNMCSFCVVPFTRGRERSRDPFSIVAEARDLFDKGFKEITLLGQNVDSYKWKAPENLENTDTKAVSFAELLAMVAQINPQLRVRFSTSHPKDITNEVLETMARYDNICKHIHLPIQSGNSRVLEIMNRTYTREWFLERMESINRIIPECAVTSDIIAGFCTETEEEHKDTMSVIEEAKFAMSYMYVYSERPGTLAAKKYKDDVSEETKKRRLAEIITVQRAVSHQHNINDIGKTFEVLVEKESKKNKEEWCGRNSQSKVCIFPKTTDVNPGDYVMVKITSCTSAALLGELVENVS